MKDQRKFIHFHCFVFLFIIYPFTLSSTEYLTIGGEKHGWEVSVHPDRGTIKQFRQLMGDVWETIPFRDDSLAGPAWSGMQLCPSKSSFMCSKLIRVIFITHFDIRQHTII